MRIDLRSYDHARDFDSLPRLWRGSGLEKDWPISQTAMEEVLIGENYRPGDYVVAEVNGQVVGFGGSATDKKTATGEVMLLMVDEAKQRKGIGGKLLAAIVDRFQAKKIEQMQLGSGAASYFWPGVPKNLEKARSFFEKQGFVFEGECQDLVINLSQYQLPEAVLRKVSGLGLRFVPAEDQDKTAIEKFWLGNFSSWLPYFMTAMSANRLEDILLVKKENEIIGGCLIEEHRLWKRLLEEPVGAPGALGIAKDYRNRGIGLALAAMASENLKQRGYKTAWVGYTYLADWYGKLGYRVFREYLMSGKKLEEARKLRPEIEGFKG